jgi:DNA-binding MarR family transcriptional regulator
MTTATTLQAKDIAKISAAITTVLGVTLEEICSTKRLVPDKYLAKVALCHLLSRRGHSPATIAGITNMSQSNVYGILDRHEKMIYGDILYKRSLEAIKQLI